MVTLQSQLLKFCFLPVDTWLAHRKRPLVSLAACLHLAQFHSITHLLASPARSHTLTPVSPTFKFHRHMSYFLSDVPQPPHLTSPLHPPCGGGRCNQPSLGINYLPFSASFYLLVSMYK